MLTFRMQECCYAATHLDPLAVDGCATLPQGLKLQELAES